MSTLAPPAVPGVLSDPDAPPARGVPFRLLLGDTPPEYLDIYPPRLTHEAFWEFCQMNPDVRVEQDPEGRLIFMHPVGWEGGSRNNEVSRQLGNWNVSVGEPGYVADSSAGYRLPNGATRSPDASWTLRARIDVLTDEQRQKFAPLCPDFVIELLSSSDSLPVTREKMQEWQDNGARLGLLINRRNRTVEVYRPGQDMVTLHSPEAVACDPEMPGLTFDMSRIF